MLLEIWMLSTYIDFVKSYQVIAIICSSQVHIRQKVYQLHLTALRTVLWYKIKWLRKQLKILFTFSEIIKSVNL